MLKGAEGSKHPGWWWRTNLLLLPPELKRRRRAGEAPPLEALEAPTSDAPRFLAPPAEVALVRRRRADEARLLELLAPLPDAAPRLFAPLAEAALESGAPLTAEGEELKVCSLESGSSSG